MNNEIKNIVLTGLFIGIGIVLSTVFHSIGLEGRVFLPMHFPVLICGIMLGWKYGLICGFITPFLASFTGMPPLLTAFSMSFELAAYGLISGLIYNNFNIIKNKAFKLYLSLIIAIIIGRAISSLIYAVLFVLNMEDRDFITYLTALFITAFPGILLQILIIPGLIVSINKMDFVE